MVESYAKNGMNSTIYSFKESKKYKDKFPYLPPGETQSPGALHDFRSSKGHFYGLVDHREDPIMLNNKFLKPLPSGRGRKQFALNFVADAFSDLKEHLSSGRGRNKVKNSPFANPIAKKGWVNYKELYDTHISEMYNMFFTSFLQTKDRHRCINKVDQFIDSLIYDYLTFLEGIPITRSSFLLTLDPAISGLVIEISEDDHTHDLTKWRKWINNLSFSYFRFAAAKYGFFVDLNAPWRLVANLASPNMFKYMEKYNIFDIKSLFSRYYIKSYKHDVQSLKSNLFLMYNDFIENSPRYVKAHPKVGGGPTAKSAFTSKTTTTVYHRENIDRQTYHKRFDNSYWLKIYAHLRLREGFANIAENDIYQKRLKAVLFRAEELNKHVDFSKALDYINDYVKNQNQIGPGNFVNLM